MPACSVTSSAVVGSSASRSFGRRERHRDERTLAHPARELVGVAARAGLGLGNPHSFERGDRFAPRVAAGHVAVRADDVDDVPADRNDRIPGGGRLLRHVGDARAAHATHLGLAEPAEVAPLEDHRAGHDFDARRQEPQERERADRLPAAGLSDEPDHLPRREREREPVHHAHDVARAADLDDQVSDFEQRPLAHARDDITGS
jgi:hypothetical protein